VVALYPASAHEPAFGPPTEGFRGFTLAVNLASFAETQAVYQTLQRVGDVELLEEPFEASWGGGFSWRDPEGNIWDVAWAKDSRLEERGGLTFP
jgi:uncharacterized glyoxalase superfamily protein PhnB